MEYFLSLREKERKQCHICKKNNHNEEKCYLKRRYQTQFFSKQFRPRRGCFACGRPGHLEKDCRTKQHQARQAQEHPEEETGLFDVVYTVEQTDNDEVWLIDSGATNHMTREERLFTTIDKSFKIPIRIGNGARLMTTGKGNIEVMTKKGVRVIKDVFLVPEIDKNLLSVPQMVRNGYQVLFAGTKCIIYNQKGDKIAEVEMVRKAYLLRMQLAEESARMVKKENNSELWHKRLGHSGMHNLQSLQANQMVKGLPKFKVIQDTCEACVKGKQCREEFPKVSETKCAEILGLIHTDVCGPMQTPSCNGSMYILTFTDDYSHMVWVYFLRLKSDTFATFKKFKNLVETQTGKKIKKIRSDRGGEFKSEQFTRLLEENGIERQFTVAYSPQQNGVAERRNRTLMDMARSMLKDKGMPDEFWAEATFTAAYLQNRLPTRALNQMTPLEIWSGHKPSVNHLRVFGCICHVWIPAAKRRKLDDKSEKGVFMGYSSVSKGYRVYVLNTKKIEVSRDVVFEEHKSWNWKTQEECEKQPEMISNTIPKSNDEVQERIGTNPETGTHTEVQRHHISPIPFQLSEGVPEVGSSSRIVHKVKMLRDVY